MYEIPEKSIGRPGKCDYMTLWDEQVLLCRVTVGVKLLYQTSLGTPEYTVAKCSSTETEI